MGLVKTSLAIVCFMTFAISSFSSPASLKSLGHQDYLAPHNKARAEVGVPPLKWNNTLAAYAENYAKARKADCKLEHSQGPYGENIAEGSGEEFPAEEAVKAWVAEKQFYDYDTDTCIGGQQCRHYTQVVWQSSTQVGCAKVRCDSGWWFATCNYYPPGNYPGDWPY